MSWRPPFTWLLLLPLLASAPPPTLPYDDLTAGLVLKYGSDIAHQIREHLKKDIMPSSSVSSSSSVPLLYNAAMPFLLQPLVRRVGHLMITPPAKGYAVVDGLMGLRAASRALQEVAALRNEAGLFVGAQIGSGTRNRRQLPGLRGDVVLWEERWGTAALGAVATRHLRRVVDTLTVMGRLLAAEHPELRIDSRTNAMLACYPGKGAEYRPHFDNPGRNPRVVTAVYYVTPEGWNATGGDGGQLRVEDAVAVPNVMGPGVTLQRTPGAVLPRAVPVAATTVPATTVTAPGAAPDAAAGEVEGNVAASSIHPPVPGSMDVEPLQDRLVLLLSNRVRHQVMPTYRERCALTVWFTRRDKDTTRRREGKGEGEGGGGAVASCVACHSLFPTEGGNDRHTHTHTHTHNRPPQRQKHDRRTAGQTRPIELMRHSEL
jgi:hypothetical protein